MIPRRPSILKSAHSSFRKSAPCPMPENARCLSNQNIADLARSPRVLGLIKPHCEKMNDPVRAIGFDKIPIRNVGSSPGTGI